MAISHPCRVVHLTSVHIWHDTRVFSRMCRSLADAGYDVHLVVPRDDETSVQTVEGVHVHPVSRPNGRLSRVWSTSRAVCRTALDLNADIYHFHDPELIPFTLAMLARGRRVVYDAHEDVPQDLADKHWLSPTVGRALSVPIDWIERFAAGRFAAVVASEEAIENRFRKNCSETVTIHNYPRYSEFGACVKTTKRKSLVVHFGGISRLRAIEPLVQAFGLLPMELEAQLIVSGRCESDELMDSITVSAGYRRVDYVGWITPQEIRSYLGQAAVAMNLFSPAPNNQRVRSNRFYESLACGVPVVCSHFPEWKAIVDEIGCGLVVDPDDPERIADAIEYLLTHPDEARQMGNRGQEAIAERFNWETEKQKLFLLYDRLLKGVANA